MTIIRLLCAVLKPRRQKQKNGLTWQPTIIDSMNSICIDVDSTIELENMISKKKSFYLNVGLTIQPMIFKINSNETTSYNVYFDGNFYSFNNFLQSFDICFKMFIVLNLKYPVESEKIYLFCQHYFYKIADSQLDPIIETIINEL